MISRPTPMKQRSFIVLAAVVAFLVLGTVGVYAYDKSRDDTVAKGVKAGGIDIGGMSKSKARTTLTDQLSAQLARPLSVSWHGRRYTLSARTAAVRVDVNGMVDDALARSRDGNILSRAVRSLTGGKLNAEVPVKLAFSQPAVERFAKRVEAGVDRPAQDAHVSYSSSGIDKVPGRNGVTVVPDKFRAQVDEALRTPSGDRTVTPVVTITKPKLTTRQLAAKYPSIIVVCRSCFQLRYYHRLKLDHTYPIAVGRQGLETPAGLYDVQDMQINPSWHVPTSSWAGSLAGQTIPPGPQDPLKARWLGFNGGAGIHGTAESGSLGTAASHGCIRMAIPDVIELYRHMNVGDPVYIG
jgi:lipoprotein-anchoring transpeptidase ErfK/SrfK